MLFDCTYLKEFQSASAFFSAKLSLTLRLMGQTTRSKIFNAFNVFHTVFGNQECSQVGGVGRDDDQSEKPPNGRDQSHRCSSANYYFMIREVMNLIVKSIFCMFSLIEAHKNGENSIFLKLNRSLDFNFGTLLQNSSGRKPQ